MEKSQAIGRAWLCGDRVSRKGAKQQSKDAKFFLCVFFAPLREISEWPEFGGF